MLACVSVLRQIHSDSTTAYVALLEFNTTYIVEVAAYTQTGSGMVSHPVSLFVPENSKLLSSHAPPCLSLSSREERSGLKDKPNLSFFSLFVDWILSPSSSPDTGTSDYVYVVLGVVCGICLLLLVLGVAICIHNGALNDVFWYADRN